MERLAHALWLTPEEIENLLRLMAAAACGMIVGINRDLRGKPTGMRTLGLVGLGAALISLSALQVEGMEGHPDATSRVVQGIVQGVMTGIGFLGAGVIMKEGMNVRGLNTAATLWCSAAVGACTGTGMVAEATLLTCFVLAGNTLLRPLVNMINRIPIDDRSTEATYEVSVISSREAMPQMRDLLVERLEAADYPVSDVEITDRGNNTVEIVATLVSTAVDPHEIEAVTSYLEQ
ncbi:MAG: MgtC/SapB family protein, partial [Starkeya sp.]|nr:MgtC/SapB family protein [Starkeya sp.]